MLAHLKPYLREEHGAVTVDWTVLSAAAVAMALATLTVMNGGIDGLKSRLEAELRTQQLSDNFVNFTSEHFEDFYETGSMSEEEAAEYFELANGMMNQDIIDMLEEGIPDMTAGELTQTEIEQLYAVASVAYQRNIIDDAILEYHFGFSSGSDGGSDPASDGGETPTT